MIRLIPIDAALLKRLESADRFLERYDADISGHIEVAQNVVSQTLDLERRVGSSPPWIGYLVVSLESGAVIGSGGFKGNPTDEGTVEIAYFTFPEYEGQGFGTATAAELVGIAQAASGVRSVIAHTLPEKNASTRILEKVEFELRGEVMDPEDGRVWRWERELQD